MKPPYEGLYNFVGGKVEPDESSIPAAYRELYEETGISRNQITLFPLMDITYYQRKFVLELYVGQLQDEVELIEEKNPLIWMPLTEDFADSGKYAGDKNIATKKCNDTRKAERFFKERGIKYQFIDMKEKGMSKGEFTSVAQANGGIENMVNWEGRDKDTLALIQYIADEDKLEKILENPQVIKTPMVRNGKQSTLGYQPEIWKGWS